MHRNFAQQNRGAAMMVFVLFFMFAATVMALLFASSVFADLRMLSDLETSKQSNILSESLSEDVAFRYIFGTYNVDPTETLAYGGGTAHATITEDTVNDEITIATAADVQKRVRKSQLILTIVGGTAFNYGLQAGNGGITLANSAGIEGNVYANGPIVGGGSSLIKGDVVSSGLSGLISNVHATGSAWAHTIVDSEIEKNAYGHDVNVHLDPGIHGDVEAFTLDIGSGDSVGGDVIADTIDGGTIYGNAYYCTKLNGTLVLGNDDATNCSYAGPPDQPEAPLPISTTTVEEWKQSIIDNGKVIPASDPECIDDGGVYTIENSTTTGYVKIECDVDIVGGGSPSTVVTMTGPVWVEGNLSFTQSPEIRVDPSVGRQSTQFIVDNESDRLTSSKVEVRNSTTFTGSGHSSSFVLVLSRNESAENGGSEVAIKVSQSANGDVLMYAGQGLIEIANKIELKEVTAYQIDAGNNVDIIYDTGLQNQLFTSGPGGTYGIDSWHEDF